MDTKCSECGAMDRVVFLDKKRKRYMCGSCMREYNPPSMTLIKFIPSNWNRLWNLEIGEYESINDPKDLADCGWLIRSKQRTLFRPEIEIWAEVYHMELFGDVKCGRCVDYQYFDAGPACLAVACEKMAKSKMAESEIKNRPELSRYVRWTKENA